jgi:hypothetical protein
MLGKVLQGFMMLAPSGDDVVHQLGKDRSWHASLATFCSIFGALIADIHDWLVRDSYMNDVPGLCGPPHVSQPRWPKLLT